MKIDRLTETKQNILSKLEKEILVEGYVKSNKNILLPMDLVKLVAFKYEGPINLNKHNNVKLYITKIPRNSLITKINTHSQPFYHISIPPLIYNETILNLSLNVYQVPYTTNLHIDVSVDNIKPINCKLSMEYQLSINNLAFDGKVIFNGKGSKLW